MAGEAGPLRPAPDLSTLGKALAGTGELFLESFDDWELAAIGSDSPLHGLNPTGDAFDEITVVRLEAALRSLRTRGLAEPVGSGGGDDTALRLGGDLATVAALRRHPALLATASLIPTEADPAAKAMDAAAASGAVSAGHVIAVMHGFALDGSGLVGLLEETLSGPDHGFALCTPECQADRLFEAWTQTTGSLAIQVFVPGPSPRRSLLVLAGTPDAPTGYRTDDGAAWSRHRSGRDGWTRLWVDTVALPARSGDGG